MPRNSKDQFVEQKGGKMQHVDWVKCSDTWCNFWGIDLTQDYFFNNPGGVYIIFLGKEILYVGQGDIKPRIEAHRNEHDFADFKGQDVRVTWCVVETSLRDGIERYLADYHEPRLGLSHPVVPRIQVNHFD